MSDYQKALQHCQQARGKFCNTLNCYLSLYSVSSPLLNSSRIWAHASQGMAGLIETFTLRYVPVTITTSSPDLVAPYLHSPPVKAEPPEEEEEEEAWEQEREQSGEDDQFEVGGRSYKRGPYKSYSSQEKERAVKYYLDYNMPITEVARRLDIPCKNIKRWATEGTGQRRGGGRKRTCRSMDEGVYQWLRENYPVGSVVEFADIQACARHISDDPEFKGSRGWAIKFAARYGLRRLYFLK